MVVYYIGNVWIYSNYDDWFKDLSYVDKYCYFMCYLYVFWIMIVVYIMIGVIIVLGCCFVCIVVCCSCFQD